MNGDSPPSGTASARAVNGIAAIINTMERAVIIILKSVFFIINHYSVRQELFWLPLEGKLSPKVTDEV